MRTLLLAAVLLSLPVTPTALSAQTAAVTPLVSDTSLLALLDTAVTQADAISRAWPGFWQTPTFGLYRANRYIVVYNPHHAPKGYSPLSYQSVPEALRNRVYYFVGDWILLRGGVIPLLDTAAPGSDVQGGIEIPAEFSNKYIPVGVQLQRCSERQFCPDPLEFLLHEAFHSWQRGHYKQKFFEAGQFPEERTLSTSEIEQLRAEKAALIAVLQTPDDRSLVSQYLELREHRFRESSEVDPGRERYQESLEGVAEFVGIAGAAFARRGSTETVRQRILQDVQERWNPDLRSAPEQLRARTYVTGAALAFLLDRCCGNWRAQVVEGDPLDAQLFRHIR